MVDLIGNETFNHNGITTKLSDVKRWIDLNATGSNIHDLGIKFSIIQLSLLGVIRGTTSKKNADRKILRAMNFIVNKGYK